MLIELVKQISTYITLPLLLIYGLIMGWIFIRILKLKDEIVKLKSEEISLLKERERKVKEEKDAIITLKEEQIRLMKHSMHQLERSRDDQRIEVEVIKQLNSEKVEKAQRDLENALNDLKQSRIELKELKDITGKYDNLIKEIGNKQKLSLDTFSGLAHNLKRPVVRLGNAQMYFDSIVYGKHAAESILAFNQMKYLKDATDVLYDSISSAIRKVEFEERKLRYGQDVKLVLKPGQWVPIIGEKRNLIGEARSFWGKAVESVETFIGRPELSLLKVTTDLSSPFDPDECIYIHPEELEVLIDNLSDNAAKYSFENETIEIKLKRDIRNGEDHILYSISSYGNGIDESERGKIGQKFYRGKYSSTENARNEGIGLGLYTVAKIVEHVGGQWDWQSKYGGNKNYIPGEGFKTTFFIWLPLVKKK